MKEIDKIREFLSLCVNNTDWDKENFICLAACALADLEVVEKRVAND